MSEQQSVAPVRPAAGQVAVDESHVVDGVDVDAVSEAVTACPSVSGMVGGALGSATTLLPGRKVAGVRVAGGEVRIAVRARWGVTATMLDRELRAATAPLLAGHRLHVVIGDIDNPPTATTAVPRARAATRKPATPPPQSDPVILSGAPQSSAVPADRPSSPS